MPFDIVIVLIIVICLYISGIYVYFIYLKHKQRLLWDELYAQMKIKFALFTDLLDIVKETYSDEADILKKMSGCINSFISSKAPADAAAAHTKAQAALASLEGLLGKYPLIRNGEGYTEKKNEILKVDEKIWFACQFYNESVDKFNNRIQKLPFRIVAGIFNLTKKGQVVVKRQ